LPELGIQPRSDVVIERRFDHRCWQDVRLPAALAIIGDECLGAAVAALDLDAALQLPEATPLLDLA
jgi:hypothetical protein